MNGKQVKRDPMIEDMSAFNIPKDHGRGAWDGVGGQELYWYKS